MTVKKAIKFYKSILITMPNNHYYQAAICSIKALEKQLPKEPIRIIGDYDLPVCPVCKQYVDDTEYYCSICGQAIDWGE